MNSTKTCPKCGKTKSLDEFYNQKSKKDGKQSYCKKCHKEYQKKYQEEHQEERKRYCREHEKERKEYNRRYNQDHRGIIAERRRKRYGQQSMYENKLCAQYLGIVIGERLCRFLFKDVEVMPHGNPGFDIICNKGKKIDVKTASITIHHGKYLRWKFNIDRNKIADYFILVAFDNLTNLNPLHLWMIPGHEINDNSGKSIRPSTIHKWDKWKQDINNAKSCCNELKKRKE